MDIRVGGYDVLKDGTIVCNENEPIDFIFDSSNDFTIRITFLNDSSVPDYKVNAKPFGKKGGQLEFINFNNSLGLGNGKPAKIGKYRNRELYLSYRVYSLSKGGKSFHYTWFLGKEVANA